MGFLLRCAAVNRRVTVLEWLHPLLLAALLILGSGCSEAGRDGDPGPATQRPNILFLIGDDHGYPYFGLTGSEIVQTPHLDRLAAEGTLFTQGFATSNVCRPSMWTLLTGLLPQQMHARAARELGRPLVFEGREGIHEWQKTDPLYVELVRRDPHTLPRALGRAGYVTFQGGKYWEGSYDTAGFDHGMSRPTETGDLPRSLTGWERAGGAGFALGRKNVRPVLDFIDANRERRFFIWYAPVLPHQPHNPPDELLALYRDKGLSASAMAYYAMCTWFDVGVGEVLEHLERAGLRDQTLVVYASDNGWDQEPQAEHASSVGGPLGKLSLHELAFRTPIVLSWPGRIPAGVVREELVSTADLYPTLLAYAGVAPPASRVGRDLRPLIEGRAAAPRGEVIGSTTFLRRPESEMSVALVPWMRSDAAHLTTASWHYARNRTTGEEWLYDRPDDLQRARDRLAEHPDLAREFRRRIERWRADVVHALEAEGDRG